jgi:DoxX-like family
MTTSSPTRSLQLLRWILGIVILIASVQTVWRAYPEIHAAGHQGVHAWIALVLGGVETIGAILFLLPQTLIAGGWILLVVFAVAFLFHALQGDFRGDLLIYAAATYACISNLTRRATEYEIAR